MLVNVVIKNNKPRCVDDGKGSRRRGTRVHTTEKE
jgi:hypothetical protein